MLKKIKAGTDPALVEKKFIIKGWGTDPYHKKNYPRSLSLTTPLALNFSSKSSTLRFFFSSPRTS